MQAGPRGGRQAWPRSPPELGAGSGGPSEGREGFAERMDCCGLRRGPSGRAQTDGQRDCTAYTPGKSIREGRLGPVPPQTWPGAAEAYVTQSPLCTRGHPNPAGPGLPTQLPPLPRESGRVQLCRKQLRALSRRQTSAVASSVRRFFSPIAHRES